MTPDVPDAAAVDQRGTSSDFSDPRFRRSAIEHRIEALRLAMQRVEKHEVRSLLQQKLEGYEGELGLWLNTHPALDAETLP